MPGPAPHKQSRAGTKRPKAPPPNSGFLGADPAANQISNSFALGAVLSFAGGFLDTYTYLARGGVFATAQTGNIVLLAVHAARGEINRAVYYIFPIIAFIAGIHTTELIKDRLKNKTRGIFHWRQLVLCIEIAALFIISFLKGETYHMAANITVSFVSSMQVQSFRKVEDHVYMTTMCTGNLRSATEYFYRFFHNRDRRDLRSALIYYGIILTFFAGAAAGAGAATAFAEKAALFVCGILLAAVAGMMIHTRSDGERAAK
jgi:uncharacterized membrane protein YoaK (UPF0700 family)